MPAHRSPLTRSAGPGGPRPRPRGARGHRGPGRLPAGGPGGVRPAGGRRPGRARCSPWPPAGRRRGAPRRRHRAAAGAAPARRPAAVGARPRGRRQPPRAVGVAGRGPAATHLGRTGAGWAARPVALPGPAREARLAGDGGRYAVVVDRAPVAPATDPGAGRPGCRLTLVDVPAGAVAPAVRRGPAAPTTS